MIDFFKRRFLLHVPEDDPEMALSATIFNYVCLGVIAFLAVAVTRLDLHLCPKGECVSVDSRTDDPPVRSYFRSSPAVALG